MIPTMSSNLNGKITTETILLSFAKIQTRRNFLGNYPTKNTGVPLYFRKICVSKPS